MATTNKPVSFADFLQSVPAAPEPFPEESKLDKYWVPADDPLIEQLIASTNTVFFIRYYQYSDIWRGTAGAYKETYSAAEESIYETFTYINKDGISAYKKQGITKVVAVILSMNPITGMVFDTNYYTLVLNEGKKVYVNGPKASKDILKDIQSA